ncbi:MAG: bifunctional phosphopantothenoylcysteine decarboxylase/phosphopantothenate--cysteine ligase CoaBC [Thermodesulfobacteriota bacterium]
MLEGKAIVLVVTGGIAAYKSAELARLLVREGAKVKTAMTAAATRFITPLTFETLTQNPVASDLWAADRPFEIGHISLADWAQAVVVAPATANILGKMTAGIADDFVSTFLLAVRAPILACPAMNVNMYDHPAVQANLAELRRRGCRVVEPGSGFLACGWEGRGRLPEPADILEEIKALFFPRDMEGLKVLVTSGPTREPWDDIRFLSNRSTGRMGLALAQTARRRGAEVILVTGPVNFPPPYGIRTIPVETTLDMRQAVIENLEGVDLLVKAAAPGDFRPAARVKGKVKKTEVPPPLELARNPDILAEIGAAKRSGLVLVGFAAESEDLLARAEEKLRAKNLDLIVANQIGPPDESFGAATNRVWILDRQGQVEEVPLATKEEVAGHIWDRALRLPRSKEK